MTEDRPWGNSTILEDRETYKIKRIEVLPGKRLSYQRHEKNRELVRRGRGGNCHPGGTGSQSISKAGH